MFTICGYTRLGSEKPTIYSNPCREIFESAVHGFHGISQRTRMLVRTLKVIKKKKKSDV